MKKVLILLLVLTMVSCGGSRVSHKNEPDLQKVVEQIQHQYVAALDELKKNGITGVVIKEAEISLKISKSVSGNAGIKVKIFKPKGSAKRTVSSSVTYVLSKDPDGKAGGQEKIINNQLKDIIVDAATNFNKLHSNIGDLTKKEFKTTLSLGIEYEYGGEITFEVLGVGIEGGATKSRLQEHEVVLTFEIKNPGDK